MDQQFVVTVRVTTPAEWKFVAHQIGLAVERVLRESGEFDGVSLEETKESRHEEDE